VLALQYLVPEHIGWSASQLFRVGAPAR
jgi:hypothetical protein